VTPPVRSTDALIKELVRATGAVDAPAAIRLKARELIQLFVASFGEPTMPINVDVLASLRGIGRSEDMPRHSADAEIVPDGTGGVTMRVNPDRPETRQRFSVAHEISHTFFPDYSTKRWCRPDARFRDRTNPDEYLEMLCDIAAAELLFPQPWFSTDAATVADASGLVCLATTYHASREATIRRYAETSPESLAAVFFTWKLKPTQKATIGQKGQVNLFGIRPEEQVREALRLRIEYTAMSEAFKADGHFLPKDKSVENEGPTYEAASTGNPAEGECFLDLGQAAGRYHVWAVPLWTADDQMGSNGESTVVAVLRPITIHKPHRKKQSSIGPLLFGE
jgi:Zn-dependent peptidase ImmA (M78 family)